MKFSEMTEEQWQENGIYYDTCLLPVTGLAGGEDPVTTTAALERLADAIDLVEVPFKGRVVIYPAYHYWRDEDLPQLARLCRALKEGEAGFKHVILTSGVRLTALDEAGADLTFMPDEQGALPAAQQVRDVVMGHWSRSRAQTS
ncbi:hypothetical protein PA598K_01057 [Paenibacillus sp. 598K]|uniref:DUF2487 family protein n=1 Tax=Paenibacillus sp. 598K TaxID=1117987 RepID=UPI000FFA2FF7|nr:DUF2487 family protein [Paenibacillus sp. 598K]GBF72789.1 hypothetical protein PA598K_01057 [Paenibacillus sp. 598K]